MFSASTLYLPIGLGLFFFSMRKLEKSFSKLGSGKLKPFIARKVNSAISGVLVGAGATAILQSSSLVGLLTMALVASNNLRLRHAFAVIIGSNLGTTVTGWLIVAFGFKLDPWALVLLLAIIFSSIYWFYRGNKSKQAILTIYLTILGLLFGVYLMKQGVGVVSDWLTPEQLVNMSHRAYFFSGMLTSAITQSSSATIAVVISALNESIISLDQAVAIALGADLGTTSTLILGALLGASIKRQVALMHVLYNLVVNLGGFLILASLLWAVTDVLQITEPLFALVAFHSITNVVGVLVFLPLLKPLERISIAMTNQKRN